MERFFSKVNKTDGCWEWTGSFTTTGYGSFYDKKMYRAHRFSWVLFNGDIPDGLHVCHTCDNRKCVNPEHLFLGTNMDNLNDRQNKGRQAKGTKNGRYTHGHYSKFDPVPKDRPAIFLFKDTVVNIREELSNRSKNRKTLQKIAQDFGVNYYVIRGIWRGQSYKKIQ